MARDFGDFQTPPLLADAILKCLSSQGKIWTRAFEPTCGQGNFISSLLKQTTHFAEIQGIEIQDKYTKQAAIQLTNYPLTTRLLIRQANLFDVNLTKELQWNTKGPLLVIGNPPWVTNAELGLLGSTNLPDKINLKGLKGIDARTGSSNFDIAEYIWLKLIKELATEKPTIAMLCKTSVARNVLHYAYKESLPITHASIYRIDAKKWFNAAVDACLFYIEVGSENSQYKAAVYQDVTATEPESTIGIVDGQLVTNTQTHILSSIKNGVSPIVWRQGLKHDAASAMELIYVTEHTLQNKQGEEVLVEPDYIYPLLKSSDLFHLTEKRAKKAVLVTQKKIGADTLHLEQSAPQLWSYLNQHRHFFENRKSSIYNGQPPFAIFGIGDYSFAPYKVAISGLHKILRFRAIGPINNRPVMVDDTCYFIPCVNAKQAAILATLLNDPICLDYLKSIVFMDAKRPVTKMLLQRVDVASLFNLVEPQSLITNVRKELQLMGELTEFQVLDKLSLDNFLFEYKLHTTLFDTQENLTHVQELPFSWTTVL